MDAERALEEGERTAPDSPGASADAGDASAPPPPGEPSSGLIALCAVCPMHHMAAEPDAPGTAHQLGWPPSHCGRDRVDLLPGGSRQAGA